MMENAKVKLKYGSGKTINLGNYESARVDCGIEVMCDNSRTEIEKVWKRIKRFVDDKLEEGVKAWEV